MTQFKQTMLALAVPVLLCCTANFAAAATIGTPSYVAGSSPTDLSAVGTLDWRIYGKQGGPTQTPSQSKSGGTSITMLAPVVTAPNLSDNTGLSRSSATFSWTGGTPTASGSAVDPYDNGFNYGNAATNSYYDSYETMTFVPGDTQQHTIHLYGYESGSPISFQFSNSLAGVSSVVTNFSPVGSWDYSVTFQADNPTNVFTVVFTFQKTGSTGTAKRMGIQAATIDAYVPPSLIWQGNVNPNWDIATTANWTNSSGAAVNYTETGGVGDTSVTFDDTAINYFVNVTTAVHPLSIIVTNSANDYVISNSPGVFIGGPGTLTKQGAGRLTLVGTSNAFTGGLVLSGGTLRLGANDSIPDGAGKLGVTVSANTTLDLNGYSETINGFNSPSSGTIDNVAGGGSSTLTVGNNDASSTFGGVIQNSSGTVALVKIGTGSLTLSGTNTFAGGVTLNAGKLILNSPGALGAGPLTFGASGVQLDNSSAAPVTLTSTNAQNWNGDFTFTGTRNLNFGPGSVTMNASRAVTVNGNSLAVGGPVSGGGFGLTKNGIGTLQIIYSNTFNGPILVNAGGLQLSTAHQGGGTVTLAANASLQVNSGLPGTTLSTSALTFGITPGNTNVLTLNFETSTNPATALITAGVLSAPNSVKINISGSALSVGQFPLISYSGSIVGSGFAAFQLGTLPYPSFVATLVDNTTNHSVDLNITAAGGPPKIWVGGVNSNWNISGTTNWLDSVLLVPAVYTETIVVGDVAQFDDTASNATVNVVAPVKPYSVTVNSSNLNYTIGGAAITGPGSFTKQGAGALTLTTANTFTNSFNLQGGTLYLGVNGAMGAGLVNLSGGTLSSDGATARTITNALVVAANSTFGDGGVGSGSLNFSGPADLGGNNLRLFTANVPVTFSAGFTNGGFWKAGASSITLQSGTYPFANYIQVLNGTLTLNGATVNNQNEIRVVANQTNGTSRLVLNGGSLTGGTLRLGFSDFGNTTAGGLASMATNIVDVAGLLNVGNNSVIMGRAAAWCELNLLTNGILRTANVQHSDITANNTPEQFTFNGGTLQASTNSNAANFMTGLDNAYIMNGGAIIDSAGFDITIGQALQPWPSSTGGLTKIGAGTLTLGGTNTYIGNTTVSNGTLLVNGLLVGTATVQTNASLGGKGTVGGVTTMSAGANLSPGTNSIGTLTFSGDLTLNAASTNNFVVTTAGGISNSVFVVGQLSPNNSVVRITSGTSLAVGTYPNLFIYGSNNASTFNPTPVFDVTPAGVSSIVNDGVGHINLVVSSTPLFSTNAYLTALAITPAGALSPAFTTNGFSYMATNAFTDTPTVTVTNADLTATNTLFLNGVSQGAITSGVPSLVLTLNVGSNNVAVRVVSQDLTVTNLYTVNATKLAASLSTNAYLTALAITPAGALSPAFTTNGFSYMATNAFTDTPTVTVTNADLTATNTLFLNGASQGAITSGVPSLALTLNVGSNNVAVRVVSQDLTVTNLYTVIMTKLAAPLSTNAYLTALAISPAGTLSPAFTTNGLTYAATNAFASNPVTVTATSGNTNATLQLSFNGGSFTTPVTNSLSVSGNSLNLTPSPLNTVAVKVTAQDGVTTNLYTVNVLLQPSLAAFKVTNSVSGSTNLVLTWPVDHTGYNLLTQTNNLNKGVSKNTNDWGTLGYTTTNAAVIPITKTNLNSYYRLVYP